MKKGFTLIEVLVTSLILMIGITGLIMSFVYSQRMVIEDMNTTNATMIINEQFEEIQRLSTVNAMNDVILPYTTTPKTIQKNVSTTIVRDYKLQFNVLDNLYPTPTASCVNVEAVVSWIDFKGDKKLSMTIITNDTE